MTCRATGLIPRLRRLAHLPPIAPTAIARVAATYPLTRNLPVVDGAPWQAYDAVVTAPQPSAADPAQQIRFRRSADGSRLARFLRRAESLPLGLLLGGGIFALLLATAPGHLYSVDGLAYYRTATQLAWHGSLMFDPPFTWGSSTTAPLWPVGYSLALLPAALLGWPLRDLQPVFDPATPYNQALLYEDPVYLLAAWVNPLLVAATAVGAAAIARRVGVGQRLAVVVAVLTAFGSPLLFYARADFAQPAAALLLVSGVLVALRIRDGEAGVVWLALICGWAILVRPLDGAITTIVVLIIVALPRLGWSPPDRVRRLAVLAGGAALGVGMGLAVNLVRRGHLLDFGQGFGQVSLWTSDPTDVLLAYLVSPGRGLPWHFPLIVVAALGVVALVRSRRHLEALALTLPIVLFLGVHSFWGQLGAWSFGPRLLVPMLPLAAILAGVAWQAARAPAMRGGFTLLAAAGVLANVAVILVDQLPWWGIRGSNTLGTPGFDAQFEWAAYAPIGSLELYAPTTMSEAADVLWLRALPVTGGFSLAVAIALVGVGALGLGLTWRRTSSQRESAAHAWHWPRHGGETVPHRPDEAVG